MDANSFRHYMEVQTRTVSADAVLQDQPTYETVAYLWGDIKPLSSNEQLLANQLEAITTHTINTRYRTDLDIDNTRLKWVRDGVTRYFNITGIKEPDFNMEFLVLDVVESSY